MTAASDAFGTLVGELDSWQAAGITASVWLRDDDAVALSAGLDRLLGLTGQHGCPVLIAAIPAYAVQALADRLAGEALAVPCVHGFRHENHAPAPLKKTELIENGPSRSPEHVVEELRGGLSRLHAMFGIRLAPILVPPWNRMSDAVARHVHEAGFAAVSGFGDGRFPSQLPQFNAHVDIVDWRGGRAGHSPALVAEMTMRSLRSARQSGATAIGILTHHLVHDEVAWTALGGLLDALARHPACRFADAREFLPAPPQ